MPAVHIRDIPESVLAALKARAARAGRSMQQELRLVLEDAAAEPPPPARVDPIELRTTTTPGDADWTREGIYGDAGR